MTTTARKGKQQRSTSWWGRRRNRNALWLSVACAGVVGIIAVVVWARSRDIGVMSEGDVPVGQTVQAVQLEDSRTGETFDLGQYLGKRDVVVFAYMGDFCLGCAELVAELELRVADFDAADAYVVALGYEVGNTGMETVQKRGIKSYPLLQEYAPYAFTKSIGMWSDMMDMPFMGYIIIDKSGKIVAGEQTSLSEAKGAAPGNVDYVLAALEAARSGAGAPASSNGAIPTIGAGLRGR